MSDRGSLENLKQEIVENIYTNENQAVTGDLLQDVLIDAVDTMGVSVSQNTETGHTDINIGSTTNEVPSITGLNNSNIIREKYSGSFKDDGEKRQVTSADYYYVFKVSPLDVVNIVTGVTQVGFLVCKTYTPTIEVGETLDLSSVSPYNERVNIAANSSYAFTIPNDGEYLIVVRNVGGTESPSQVTINNYPASDSIEENITKNIESIADLQDETINAKEIGVEYHPCSFTDDGTARMATSADEHLVFPISAGQKVKIQAGVYQGLLLVCTTYSVPSVGSVLNLSATSPFNERITITALTTQEFIMPSDAAYCVIVTNVAGNNLKPTKIFIDGYNIYKSDYENTMDALNQLNGYSIWKGTQEQYDAITTKDSNTIYFIV